jgi:membrane protein
MSLHARVSSLVDLLRRVNASATEHDADIVAAGLSYYGLLGLFPALLAVVSIYGLIADPTSVEAVLTALVHTLPAPARQVVVESVAEFVRRSSGELTFHIVLGIVAVLWSSSSGMGVLVRAINVAYGIRDHRSFFGRRALALLFTLGGVIGVTVVVPALTALPKLFHVFRADILLVAVPPLALALAAFVTLLVLFRYAPYRRPATFAEIAPGAALAAVAWLVVSGAYSLYVRFFSRLSSTYGALEGVVVLELWFYFSALVLLYAAELNVVLADRRSTPNQIRNGGELRSLVANELE